MQSHHYLFGLIALAAFMVTAPAAHAQVDVAALKSSLVDRIDLRMSQLMAQHAQTMDDSPVAEDEANAPDDVSAQQEDQDPDFDDMDVDEDTDTDTNNPDTQGTTTATSSATSTPDISATSTESDVFFTEVYYNTATSEDPIANQWVELYNNGSSSVNLDGWRMLVALNNATSSEATSTTGTTTVSIPLDGVTLAPQEFLIVTVATSTDTLWTMPNGTWILHTGEPIGPEGLDREGAAVYLYNPSGALMDAISYGNNTDVFDQAIVTVGRGQSIVRIMLPSGALNSGDWSQSSTPNPGS